MKTFIVTIKGKQVGRVTAYTFTEATRKAADRFNNGNWGYVGVILK